MGSMTEGIGIAEGRPFTVGDLEGMPDDGRRYELIDGMLHVSPAPVWLHQRMLFELAVLLRAACPSQLEVLPAPFAARTSPADEVQPDILVARVADLTDACLPVAPVLAVEVASPSTRLNEGNTKKAHYARIGVAAYWLLDPAQPGGLEVHELDERGAYRLLTAVTGEQSFTAARPFPVSVCPARLLEGLRPR